MIVTAPAGDRGVSRARAAGATIVRLALGAALLWALAHAVISPDMPRPLGAAAVLMVAAALWRPQHAFTAAIAAAPFGALAAGIPVRATETLLWAFFAGWLLRLTAPLDPSCRVPRRVIAPAASFAVIVACSWAVIVAERSVGLAPWPLAREVLTMLPADYLVIAGRDPQVATAFQLLLAVAVCLAAPALAGRDAAFPRRLAIVIAAAGLVAAAATVLDVPLRYVRTGNSDVVTRYLRGERYSLHMNDVNAAGSHLVLVALIALAFARERTRLRTAWRVGLLFVLPALWLSGSRTAVVGAVALTGVAWWFHRAKTASSSATARRRSSTTALLAAGVTVVAIMMATLWLVGRRTDTGGAGLSLDLRSQFLLTSARMLATAPAFGVGIGNYYEYSARFMPEQIRTLYGHENAHNYFAQVTAELGLIGGGVFVWWVVAILRRLWANAAAETRAGAALALFCGCAAFLLTCVTGHPLLVVEAAVPFWAAAGAGLALRTRTGEERAPGEPETAHVPRPAAGRLPRAAATVCAVVTLAALPVRARERLLDPNADFTSRGLHEHRRDASGLVYRWTTEHAVTFVGAEPGLVTIPLRARAVPGMTTPVEATIYVSGYEVERHRVPTDRWLPVTIVLRGEAPSLRRRIDVRVNETWSAKRHYGHPDDARPMGVMMGEPEYLPRPYRR